MRIAIVLLAVLAQLAHSVGCTATEDNVDARQHCIELRDHLVDLRLKHVADPQVDVAAHRTAMKQALGDSFVDGCLKDLSKKQIDCAITATDSQSATECSTSH